MGTLTVDTFRDKILGNVNEFPVVASDIIYEGAAVGTVNATGHARPLTSVDKFVGFCLQKADNSSGSAAAINVKVDLRGSVKLSVSGAVITDVNLPIYATDDNVFVFSPVGAVFIGYVRRFVSSGVVEVEYDAVNFKDPNGGRVWEAFSSTATLDIQDTGKGFWFDTDGATMTLLTYATATALDFVVANGGAFGTVGPAIDVNGSDKISGINDTGADGGIMVNTKTTANRGDYVRIHTGGADGYVVAEQKGIWPIA